MDSITKKCRKCGEEKNFSEFYKNGKYLSSYCKNCHIKRLKDWQKENPRQHHNNQQNFRRKNNGYFRNYELMRSYGMTSEDFDRLASVQNGACAICGEASKLVVDHDHESGEIRGLLCHHCNTALGLAKDSKSILQRMIEYLSK